MFKDDKIKEAVQNQFAKNAEKYVKSETHAKADDLNQLVEWLSPGADWLCLDIATGGGHVTKAISPHVAHVFATDLTQPMLEAAQKHLKESCDNVFYVVADAEALPFLSESFDAVTCRIAAHHFPNPQAFVNEVSRVLKPGGKFLLIDNIAPEDKKLDLFVNTLEKLRDESHVRSYSIAEWMNWINDSALREQQSLIRKKTFPYPVWVRRTAKSEQQVQQVTQYIEAAEKEIHEYFSVVVQDGQIVSLQVDEWMALFEKTRK
jgi:ubiquinone/menaquinone biosynthesis C-methylase UbiE